MIVARYAIARSPDNIVPRAGFYVVRKIEVNGVQRLVDPIVDAIIAIVVGLQPDIRTVVERPIPTAKKITRRYSNFVVKGPLAGERVGEYYFDRLPFARLQEVALDGHSIPRSEVPIGAESHMRRVPAVCRFLAAGCGEIAGAKKAAEGPVGTC